MKVVTKERVRVGTPAKGDVRTLEAGEHNLDDKVAKDLIKRGKAEDPNAKKAEAPKPEPDKEGQ